MRNNTKSTYSWIGTVITIGFIVAAIYFIYKFNKTPGFWYGFGAMFLLTGYLIIDSDGFKLSGGGISIETSKKDYNPNAGIRFTSGNK